MISLMITCTVKSGSMRQNPKGPTHQIATPLLPAVSLFDKSGVLGSCGIYPALPVGVFGSAG